MPPDVWPCMTNTLEKNIASNRVMDNVKAARHNSTVQKEKLEESLAAILELSVEMQVWDTQSQQLADEFWRCQTHYIQLAQGHEEGVMIAASLIKSLNKLIQYTDCRNYSVHKRGECSDTKLLYRIYIGNINV